MDSLKLKNLIKQSVKEVTESLSGDLEQEAIQLNWNHLIENNTLSDVEIEIHIKRELRSLIPGLL
jgi:hypothetical protein